MTELFIRAINAGVITFAPDTRSNGVAAQFDIDFGTCHIPLAPDEGEPFRTVAPSIRNVARILSEVLQNSPTAPVYWWKPCLERKLREAESKVAKVEPHKKLWLRLGTSLYVTKEEGDAIIKGDTKALTKVILDGRAVPDGDSYIPDVSVHEYRTQCSDRIGICEEVNFDLSPKDFT